MTDLKTLVEHEMQRAGSPQYAIGDLVEVRDRKRRNKRIAAGVVAIAIFATPVALFALHAFDRTQSPATISSPSSAPVPETLIDDSAPVPEAPKVDYVIDLDTNVVLPLPETILRSVVGATWRWTARYAVSSDGTRLAFVGIGDDGNAQIFVADLDGADVRQVTHDMTSPTSPAWSPDGTMIAYVGNASAGRHAIFVLDVASGETRQVIDGNTLWDPTFTPDGSTILYSGSDQPGLRTVPIAGGKSTLLIGPSENINDAGGNGSMSPDGSLVTFLGTGSFAWPGHLQHCGPCRFISNADGTGRRIVSGWMAIPAGTWSPDGTRIVTMEMFDSDGKKVPSFILVVDVATGAGTKVADGRAAIWINDHMLLVEP